jgi:probable F420-dependent oxidoreductase
MKVGVFFGNLAYGTPDMLEAFAEAVEQNGIESVWGQEHPAVTEEMTIPGAIDADMTGDESGDNSITEIPFPDPIVWLSQVAALTKTVKVGTGAILLPLHNPVLLARATATLDQLSNGRLIVGVALGWLKEEFEACGVNWHDRAARLEEYIEALRAAWSDEGSFEGETVSFSKIRGGPKPASGRIPIHIGASMPKAARRAGRMAEGFFPLPFESSKMAMVAIRATISGEDPDWSGYTLPPELKVLIDECRSAATEEGRNPDDIELTVAGPPSVDAAKQAIDVGASRYLITPPAFELSKVKGAFGRLADEFISVLN